MTRPHPFSAYLLLALAPPHMPRRHERRLIRSTRLGERPKKWLFAVCLCIFTAGRVFLACVCMCVCFFYNLQSPRTSSMTECKYSHTVFYPKMASASGTNIVRLKTYICGNGIKESLLRCQIMSQFFLLPLDRGAKIFFRRVDVYFFPLHVRWLHPKSLKISSTLPSLAPFSSKWG